MASNVRKRRYFYNNHFKNPTLSVEEKTKILLHGKLLAKEKGIPNF
jgi:hypothetical protein